MITETRTYTFMFGPQCCRGLPQAPQNLRLKFLLWSLNFRSRNQEIGKKQVIFVAIINDFNRNLSRPSLNTRHVSQLIGPLQLSDHVVQNRQTGEQMTHWDILNNLVALLNMPHAVRQLPFAPRDRSAAKGLFSCQGA